ncbi:hypothetical protein V1504DRAFT_493703 [Lipomyces starkeyi]
MQAFRFPYFLKCRSNSLWNASVLLSDPWTLRVRQSSPAVLNPMTRTKPAIMSTDTVPANDADYDKALSLLTHNPPEQRSDIPMPYSQYLQIEKSWSKFKSDNNISEEKSLSYNALMRIATVVTTQSALHDRTAAVFREIIKSNVNEYLSIHKPNERRRIKDNASTTVKALGPYGKTSKDPDESFLYERPDRKSRLQVVVECGVSENYKDLCRDKNLWIQHLGAKAVILICLKDAPPFKNPRATYDDIKDPVAEVIKMQQYALEAMQYNLEQGHCGPIEYRSHMWAGKLDEVFVEVWRAGKTQPVRKWLIRDGRHNRLPKTIGLKISDFFPEDPSKIQDSNVPLHGGRYILWEDLAGAMRWTAEMRFIDFLDSSGLPKD